MSDKPKIVLVLGPTASGKSSFALDVCHRFDAEIVSIDSVQIYKRLDIGTAKPSVAERADVPHHLIDIFEPDQQCNVARFIELADEAIEEITARGKRVVAVGGTNLYVRGLKHGVFDAPPPNQEIREQHQTIVAEEGAPALHAQLETIDPESAERIHPNDAVRSSRALEVFELTGKTMTALQAEHGFKEEKFETLSVAMSWDRDTLYDRINARVDQMMASGLLEEYRGLIADRFDPELPSLNALGYSHMRRHVFDGWTLEDAVERMKRDTRRFAKQQLSWLRGKDDVRWIDPKKREDAMQSIASFWNVD